MRQLLLKRLKNQKGLTLIELLAVIVILGIIAAIAVPSIAGIIDNSKKDAHVANAQQMINATKLVIVAEPDLRNMTEKDDPIYVPLGYLIDEGYIDAFSDPDGGEYDGIDKKVIYQGTTEASINALESYVKVVREDNTFIYSVFLTNGDRGVDPMVEEKDLKRSAVN